MKSGEFVSPKSENIFTGITIQAFAEFCSDFSFKNIALKELNNVQEAYAVNAVKIMTPIKEIDGVHFNNVSFKNLKNDFVKYLERQK
jgi:branched-subunit amino acid aminotransferase/4-amino-4-deoxychorismate lyase